MKTIAVIVVVGLAFLSGCIQQPKQSEEVQQAIKKIEGWAKAEANPDFYGEILVGKGSPENCFFLSFQSGQSYITRYEEEGNAMSDPSISAYAAFDPNTERQILIWINNSYIIPLELDFDNDRYYVQTYGGKLYQTNIESEALFYPDVINPDDSAVVFTFYPGWLSDIDIKNVLVWLSRNETWLGLQKIPK